MAKRVVTTLVSDKSGKEIAPGKGETISFALDGVQYEIDLTEEEAGELVSILAEYIKNGRRVGGRKTAKTGGMDPEQSRAIREWAQANGLKVSSRGRISTEVQKAYHAAH